MIRNKYGPNMIAKDKETLDSMLNMIIADVGLDYGTVLEQITAVVEAGDYSQALKYNVLKRTSWFLSYLKNFIDLK